MAPKHASKADSSSGEPGPIIMQQQPPTFVSAPSSEYDTEYDTPASEYDTPVSDGDSPVTAVRTTNEALLDHAGQPDPTPDDLLSRLMESDVRVEARHYNAEFPESTLRLRLTIGNQVLFLDGARTMLPNYHRDADGLYLISSDTGHITRDVRICPRCNGWSVWFLHRGKRLREDDPCSACELCNGDGAIPQDEYPERTRRSRRRDRHQRDGAFAQIETVMSCGQGSHLRAALSNRPDDNGANSRTGRAIPSARHSQNPASRSYQGAHDLPTPAAQPATYFGRQPRAINPPTRNFDSPPQEDLAQAELVRRLQEALRSQPSVSLPSTLRDAYPDYFEPSPPPPQFSSFPEPTFGANYDLSPYHTENYLRAVREFEAQQLEESLRYLPASEALGRRLGHSFHGRNMEEAPPPSPPTRQPTPRSNLRNLTMTSSEQELLLDLLNQSGQGQRG